MSEPSFSPDKFDAQFQRILEATGCKTQVELADILEVRQSAISDAKRRMTIPSNWLETLREQMDEELALFFLHDAEAANNEQTEALHVTVP